MILQDFARSLTRFSEISFLYFIFQYVFRKTFTCDKVFYFFQVNVLIVGHLSKIYLQSVKSGFIWPKTFNFLFQKNAVFYSEKRGIP